MYVSISNLIASACSYCSSMAPVTRVCVWCTVPTETPTPADRLDERGSRNLVWSGLRQLLLDLVCIAVSASIGIEEQLDKALISTTACGLIVGVLFLGELDAHPQFYAAMLRGGSFTAGIYPFAHRSLSVSLTCLSLSLLPHENAWEKEKKLSQRLSPKIHIVQGKTAA